MPLYLSDGDRLHVYSGMAEVLEEEAALSLDEVAHRLGCTRRSVERLAAVGRLAIVKVGRLTRVAPAELARFLAEGGTR